MSFLWFFRARRIFHENLAESKIEDVELVEGARFTFDYFPHFDNEALRKGNALHRGKRERAVATPAFAVRVRVCRAHHFRSNRLSLDNPRQAGKPPSHPQPPKLVIAWSSRLLLNSKHCLDDSASKSKP